MSRFWRSPRVDPKHYYYFAFRSLVPSTLLDWEIGASHSRDWCLLLNWCLVEGIGAPCGLVPTKLWEVSYKSNILPWFSPARVSTCILCSLLLYLACMDSLIIALWLLKLKIDKIGLILIHPPSQYKCMCVFFTI